MNELKGTLCDSEGHTRASTEKILPIFGLFHLVLFHFVWFSVFNFFKFDFVFWGRLQGGGQMQGGGGMHDVKSTKINKSYKILFIKVT